MLMCYQCIHEVQCRYDNNLYVGVKSLGIMIMFFFFILGIFGPIYCYQKYKKHRSIVV